LEGSTDPDVIAAKAAIAQMDPSDISKQADPSKMTLAERAIFAGYKPNESIKDQAKQEKDLLERYEKGEGGQKFKFKNALDPKTDPLGFLKSKFSGM
jgi:hypothetical protein